MNKDNAKLGSELEENTEWTTDFTCFYFNTDDDECNHVDNCFGECFYIDCQFDCGVYKPSKK